MTTDTLPGLFYLTCLVSVQLSAVAGPAGTQIFAGGVSSTSTLTFTRQECLLLGEGKNGQLKWKSGARKRKL